MRCLFGLMFDLQPRSSFTMVHTVPSDTPRSLTMALMLCCGLFCSDCAAFATISAVLAVLSLSLFHGLALVQRLNSQETGAGITPRQKR